jgi:hypothetical protein
MKHPVIVGVAISMALAAVAVMSGTANQGGSGGSHPIVNNVIQKVVPDGSPGAEEDAPPPA